MHIDPPDATAVQAVSLEKTQRFLVVNRGHLREIVEEHHQLVSWPQVTARELADDEGMHVDGVFLEQRNEPGLRPADVIDPD